LLKNIFQFYKLHNNRIQVWEILPLKKSRHSRKSVNLKELHLILKLTITSVYCY
jgi:hypothetical protein